MVFLVLDKPEEKGQVNIIEHTAEITTDIVTVATTTEIATANAPRQEGVTYYTPYSEDVEGRQINYIYVYGNTAYEYYNYVESIAERYANAVNKAAASLPNTKVYCMVLPTSIGIVLHDNVANNLPVSNQRDSQNKIIDKLSGAIGVPVYDELKNHKDEYLYFRTDHHWTALGAYYAYGAFMNAKGESARALTDFTESRAEGYLGSFYRDTDNAQSLAATPDTVFTYTPKCNYSFSISQSDERGFYSYPLVGDAANMGQSGKYLAFIGGDNALSLLENHDNPNGKTLVVVKDSFGNALIPFFAYDYHKVYVIDFRHFSGQITDFAKKVNANELLFASNMSMTRNGSLVTKLSERI